MADLIKYQGGCHCGAILFEVYAPKAPAIIHCKYVYHTHTIERHRLYSENIKLDVFYQTFFMKTNSNENLMTLGKVGRCSIINKLHLKNINDYHVVVIYCRKKYVKTAEHNFQNERKHFIHIVSFWTLQNA